MRSSKTLARIRNNETVRMCALGHFIPGYIKHAAHFGYDCIWLDLEHRSIDEREVQTVLAYGHLFDIDIMIRPPTLEKTRLYRYLEDGATGIMIPHVSTPEKAQMLVDAVKFPPLGDRGLDGAGLDADFMVGDTETYIDHANQETFLVAQIETPQAVENLEAIAAVPGLDGLFIGPGDLGLRIRRIAPQLSIEAVYEKAAAVCKKHGKAWGAPVSGAADIARRREQGGQILAHGGDFLAVMRALQQNVKDFD